MHVYALRWIMLIPFGGTTLHYYAVCKFCVVLGLLLQCYGMSIR